MREFLNHVMAVAKEAAREYFAPLVGTVRGIREEYRRIDEERAARQAARFKVGEANR